MMSGLEIQDQKAILESTAEEFCELQIHYFLRSAELML